MRRLPFLPTACLTVLAFFSGFVFTNTANAASEASSLSIVRITPAGSDVPPGRQIVFQFNRPVVPVGRMERAASEIPVSISPELDCQWRWLNTRALACGLDEASALKPASRYDIVVNPGIEAEDGTVLVKPVKHSFITERPAVRYVGFKTWKAPGMPFIRMTFNQPVSDKSVAEHVFMMVHNRNAQRAAIHVEPDPDVKQVPFIFPLSGEKKSLVPGAGKSSDKTEFKQKDALSTPGPEARRIWLIFPETELPANTKVELMVEPGLISYLGPESGVENRVLVSFHTFPEFAFEGVECTDNMNQEITIGPGLQSEQRCNPLRPVALVFSSPVIEESVADHVTIVPDLAGGRADYDPWANRRGYSRLGTPHLQGRKYRIWLPELLKAYQVYRLRSDPVNFRDEFGRTLSVPIDMAFATGHRPPDFTLTHPRVVLEKAIDTEMPLVVTNLDKVTVAYDRLTTKEKHSGQKHEIVLPKAEDIAFRIPLQVREMLAGQSGVVLGTVDSIPSVAKAFRGRWFFAQITPFHVHVKMGHFNTLVWVTDFKTGQPVTGAEIKIFCDTYASLPHQPSILNRAVTGSAGTAILSGTRELDPRLRFINTYKMTEPRLFVRVEKAGDLALVPLDYQFQVDTYRASRYSISPYMRRRHGHIHCWGTTAQGVYKAGDTIQYKLYVRDQNNETFVPAPKGGYALGVIDPMGKLVHRVKEATLSEFGALEGEFAVPETGAVGWYRFQLTASFSEESWEPLRVLVSDFTPAAFKVTTDLKGPHFQPGDHVLVTTRARLHAGGPYADARSRVTAILESRPFMSQDPAARGFHFDVHVSGAPPNQTIHQIEDSLDSRGDLTTSITVVENKILYGRLVVESAVRDDRGKYISGRATADYAGRDRYVGLRPSGWVMHEDQPSGVDVLVVDAQGTPQPDVRVDVKVERRETRAARVKGAGNAYLTHYSHEWVEVAGCELNSATEPVQCVFAPQDPGQHRITATIQDSRNRPHSSRIYQWVVGKGRVIWQERQDNSLEIVAEKSQVQVGDIARYLVKNPFPGARALVTVERYGVLKSWVQTLNGSTPIIEFEVDKDFLPGYFLSVVVVSPRVEAPPPDNEVDLGKPAFRMGYVKVPVADPFKEMIVEVTPERDFYKPRERVKVYLKAVPRHPAKKEPIELAVAVLDEAVFDLLAQGRDYFDPYKGFYTVDGLDLENYSLLMRLVGRQKFEKKGASTGGGGGPDIGLRSVFRFVSYWNPSLIIDAGDKTSVEFEAPDNLTGWRVLAMAVTPGDRMGLGQGSFKVNRPTEIRPVTPNQVTEGDSFEAGFSIMNRTPRSRELSMTITAEGAIETAAKQNNQKITRVLNVEPYQRATVWMPLKTAGDGIIKFVARGGDELDRDGVVHTLAVQKRYSLETAAVYGSTASEAVAERIDFPPDIRTDVGGVSVVLSASVIGNLEGAFRYMRDYPYICWEQILTKGVMASHYHRLKKYLSKGFTWNDSGGLPKTILDRAAAFQAPNGGMTYYIPQDRYVSPYLSAYTALAFGWLRKSGYEIPAPVEQKLHEYLLTLLRRNVVPDFYSKGMASTVRAVALAALARHGKIHLSDLQRYRLHLRQMSLFGKAQFLLAALEIPGSETIRAEVCRQILSHSHQSGGKFVFNELIDDGYSRILTSPVRTNGAILSALVAYGQTEKGGTLVGDIPFKLVRSITQSRKRRDYWENTQENIFCMNALVDYSRAYESSKPSISLQVLFNSEVMGDAKFDDLRDEPVEYQRPVSTNDPDRSTTIKVDRQGPGRLYYSVRLAYAPKTTKTDPVNAGIEIHREYSLEREGEWMLLNSPMTLKRGDLVRVDLFVSLPAAGNFVVVDDPVPGGLEPVNRNLATASTVDADKGKFKHAGGSWWFRYNDWSSYGVSRWSFYHQELRHNTVRFYSEYLPAGNYHLSYTAQAIAPGEFIVMPVHAEEMYDPDVYGKGESANLIVSKENGHQTK